MENPFLVPPRVESPQSRSWASGFIFAFQGPAFSSMTPGDIQPEDADAFNQGMLAGQDSAINGLALPTSCIDLNSEGGLGPHLVLEGPEIAAWVMDLTEGLAAAVGGSLLLLFNLSIALETFSEDPDEQLKESAQTLQDRLSQLGFNQSMELFLGGGVDLSAPGCELQATPIFRTRESALAAAKALGRPRWLVAAWRTDQCGSALIIDSSE